jgi:hypothetical protein
VDSTACLLPPCNPLSEARRAWSTATRKAHTGCSDSGLAPGSYSHGCTVANPAGDALSAEQIQRIINEAVDATKSAWGYCPKCREKVKADFPDHNGRINALKLALEHGYGKPGTSKDEAKVDLDVDITTLTPEARATLRKQLVALNPALVQTWIG